MAAMHSLSDVSLVDELVPHRCNGEVVHVKMRRADLLSGAKDVAATLVQSRRGHPTASQITLHTAAIVERYGDAEVHARYSEPKGNPRRRNDRYSLTCRLPENGFVAIIMGWHNIELATSPFEYLFKDPAAYDHAWSRAAVIVDGLDAKVVCNFIAAALEHERQTMPAP
jgi:hypothetical protein